MALRVVKEEIKIPEPDVYEAVLKDIKEVEKPKFGPSIRWMFEIKDGGEYDGCVVSMITNTKFSGTGKGKLDAVMDALSVDIDFGQGLDDDDLRAYIGTRVRINVEVTEDTKGNSWANVDKLWRIKKKKSPVEDGEPAPKRKVEEAAPKKRAAPVDYREPAVKKRRVEEDEPPKRKVEEDEPAPKKKAAKSADDDDEEFSDMDSVELDDD